MRGTYRFPSSDAVHSTGLLGKLGVYSSWGIHPLGDPSFASKQGAVFPIMFGLFEEHPITKQIAYYVAWKAARFPMVANTHNRILKQFFADTRIRSLTSLTPEHIRVYRDRFPAQYQRQQFEGVMRQFMKYWFRMGLLSGQFADFMQEDIVLDINLDISPAMHIDQVRRVRELRQQGFSLAQVKLRMETEDGKPYHLKQIHRWSKYLLPEEKKSLSTALVQEGV